MANISCSHNIIKKDGTTGGLFPLVSSMFPNRALEFYNAVMSRSASILSLIRNNGVGFTRDGVVLSPTLDFNQTVALIKKIDPKAVFTYDVSLPLYNEKENRYNMSKIDMSTVIPKTDKTLEDIYNEDRGYRYNNKKESKKLDSKPTRKASALAKATELVMKSISSRINKPLAKVFDNNRIIVSGTTLNRDSVQNFIAGLIGGNLQELPFEILYQDNSTYSIPSKYIKNLDLETNDYFLSKVLDKEKDLTTGERVIVNGNKLSIKESIKYKIEEKYKNLIETVKDSPFVLHKMTDSYLAFAATVADNNGQFSKAEQIRNFTEQQKIDNSTLIRNNQLKDLQPWINYLNSRPDYPTEFKYLILSDVLKNNVTEVNLKANSVKLNKRNNTTVNSFESFNARGIASIYETPQSNNTFLVDYALELANNAASEAPVEKQFSRTNKGTWYKFVNGDAKQLSSLVRDTPWCTASESTAASQLNGGDFYVFVPFNSDVNEKIAIKFEGEQIKEVRGTLNGQELKDSSTPVVDEFVSVNFPNQTQALNKIAYLKLRSRFIADEDLWRDKDLVLELDELSQYNDAYENDPFLEANKSTITSIVSEYLESLAPTLYSDIKAYYPSLNFNGIFNVNKITQVIEYEYNFNAAISNKIKVGITYKLKPEQLFNGSDLIFSKKDKIISLNSNEITALNISVKVGLTSIENLVQQADILTIHDIINTNILPISIIKEVYSFIDTETPDFMEVTYKNQKLVNIDTALEDFINFKKEAFSILNPRDSYEQWITKLTTDRFGLLATVKLIKKLIAKLDENESSVFEYNRITLITNRGYEDVDLSKQDLDYLLTNLTEQELEKVIFFNLDLNEYPQLLNSFINLQYDNNFFYTNGIRNDKKIPLIKNGSVEFPKGGYNSKDDYFIYRYDFKNYQLVTLETDIELSSYFDYNINSTENSNLYQKDKNLIKGVFTKLAEDKSLILLHKDANITTPLHELAHLWETVLTSDEKSTVLKWAGHSKWGRNTSEKFAKGFEQYVYEGVKTGDKEIDSLFEQFKQWFREIIKNFNKYFKGSDLNPEIKDIYNKMFTDGKSLNEKFSPLQEEQLQSIYSFINNLNTVSSSLSLEQNISIQKATNWINKVMPNANVELVEELIDGIGKGSYNTVADLIQLSEKYANKQTAKHEIGHRSFNRLSKKKQEELLNEGSKLFGIPRGVSTTAVKYSQVQQNEINYTLKTVDILQSDKAIQTFKTLEKNKVTGDTFWNKIQQLGIPKDQLELLKQYNTTNREELITNMLADYSFVIESNVSYGEKVALFDESRGAEDFIYNDIKYVNNDGDFGIMSNGAWRDITREEYYETRLRFEKENINKPTSYYANLTVPGGTNYTENEISTPLITPSIKGHAQFATDKGIGWFRSDEQGNFSNDTVGQMQADGWILTEEEQSYASDITSTKTRRVLEVQSDLFQKGRDNKTIIKSIEDIGRSIEVAKINNKYYLIGVDEIGQQILQESRYNNSYDTFEEAQKSISSLIDKSSFNTAKENQFLQLLNKDSNWVTFFVKSIIQDSTKKGYEKVLFPTGNTADRIEGTGASEILWAIQNKDKSVKKLDKGFQIIDSRGNNLIEDRTNASLEEIFQELLDQADTAIHNFYEKTVTNILNKQFGKENVKVITDEYGNTWNEIDLSSDKVKEQTSNIKFQALGLKYTGDLAIEEKLMEMMENTPDEQLPKTALGKWIQSVRNFFRNLFKERTNIQRFLRDVNQGRIKDRKRTTITVETLQALINNAVTSLKEGDIGVVYNDSLSLDNIQWLEVNKFIPEVAEISMKFGMPIRYNKDLKKELESKGELTLNINQKFTNGSPITVNSPLKSKIQKEYVKEMEKYLGQEYNSVRNDFKVVDSNIEEITIGDFMTEAKSIEDSVLVDESKLDDNSYKKFLVNLVEFINPLLSKNKVDVNTVQFIMTQLALSGVNIVKQNRVILDGSYIGGYYDNNTRTIYIDENLPSETMMYVLLHEAVHATTIDKIPARYEEKNHKKFGELKQLDMIYNYIRVNYPEFTEITDMQEFVAQVFTDIKLQTVLKSLATTDIGRDVESRGLFQVVLDNIYKFFRRLFDVKNIDTDTLSQTLYNIKHIIEHQQKVTSSENKNIYKFEFTNRTEDSLDSLFDIIFEGDDKITPQTIDKINNYKAEYNGPNLILDVTTSMIEVDELKGLIIVHDPGRGETKYTFERQNQSTDETDENSLYFLLKKAKEELIKSLQDRREDLAGRLAAALNTPSTSEDFQKALNNVGNAFRTNGKTLREMIVKDSAGNVKTGFRTIEDFTKENYLMGLESIQDKNVVIHMEKTKEGKNSYSLILTSVADPAGGNIASFMHNYLDDNNKEWINEEARRRGFTIPKNVKGRKQLTAALIMMKIREQDPDAIFNQIKYFSVANSNTEGLGTLQELDMNEALTNLQSIKDSELFKHLPLDIRELLEQDELFNFDQYKQSYIHVVLNYYKQMKLMAKKDVDYNGLEYIDYDFTNPSRDRKTLIDAAQSQLDYLRNVNAGKKNKGVYVLEDTYHPVGREVRMLSLMILELRSNNYGVDGRDLNKGMMHDVIEMYQKNRMEYFNPILGFTNKAINIILDRFIGKYQAYAKAKNRYTDKYLKEWVKQNGTSLRNVVTNYSAMMYTNLYETAQAQVLDRHNRPTGEVVTVNTMKLKDINDISLNANEKEYLLRTLESIRKEARELVKVQLTNKALSVKEGDTIEKKILEWERQNMKIEVDDKGNILKWGGYRLVPGLKGGTIQSLVTGDIKQGLMADFEFLHDEYLDMYDAGSLDKKAGLGVLGSFTLNGAEHPDYGRNSRLANLGLVSKHGELFVTNTKLNKNLDLDLQMNTDFYIAKLIKQQHHHQLQKEYLMGKVLLTHQAIIDGKNYNNELKMFEDQTKALVSNEVKTLKLGRGETDYNKYIKGVTSTVSKFTLGLSLGSFFTAMSGAVVTSIISTLSKQFGPRFFDKTSWVKAAKIVLDPTKQDYIMQLMEIHKLHNSDEGKAIFNKNIKAGSNTFLGKMKGVITGRNWLLLLSSGDYLTKSIMLVAQLEYDDMLQHFKYDKNKELYYDLEAERQNPSSNKYRRDEFEAIVKEMEEEGSYKNEDGQYLTGYSNRMIASLKTINSQLLGAFTDQEKTLIALHPALASIMQMKSFLIAKASMLYAREYTNVNISWLEQDTTGALTVKYHKPQGLLNTMGDLVILISSAERMDKKAWDELWSNPAKAANLRFAGISLALYALTYLAYAMIDDEWKKKNPYHVYVKASIADIVGYMNPVEYINAITTPVTIVYAKRLANAVSKMVQFDFDEAIEQSLRLTGATRTIVNFIDIAEYEPTRYNTK